MLDPAAVQALLQQQSMAMMGQMMPPAPPPPQKMYDCKVKRCLKSGRLRVEALPPEDFLLDPSATRIDEEKMRFIGDKSRVTRSDLKLRYPDKKDLIDELPAYTVAVDKGGEKQARESDFWAHRMASDKASEEIEVFELYVHVDYDGDGVAEWRQVVVAGVAGEREMLANEEWGGLTPYTDCVPNPQPHRWRGRSLFDDLEDIQKIKTVLLRQTLNNLYANNNPMRIVQLSQIENPDVMINQELGGVAISKGSPEAVVKELVVPFVAKESFPVLEYFDMVAEKRTGVGRSSMALDPSVLQNQTAEAVKTTQDIKHTKIESYARNIAECGGLKRLFKCLLRLFVENQREAFGIRLNNNWVQMDPRGWNADMDCTINVGLGAGSRDRDLATLQVIAQKQEQIVATLGPQNPVCTIKDVAKTYQRMAEAAGIKNPQEFFKDVTPEAEAAFAQQQAQQPNPEVAKEQAKAQTQVQIEQAKGQLAMQMKQMDMQAQERADAMQFQRDQQADQRKAEIEKIQAEADIATNREKVMMEAQLAREQFEFDKQLKLIEHQAKMEEMAAQRAMREREAEIRFAESVNNAQMQREGHGQKMELAERAAKAKEQQPKGDK